jgi:hypothetical protein
VRELQAQVNEGGDDPVGERQVVVRPGARGALALVSRRSSSRSSSLAAHGAAISAIRADSRARLIPVQIRFDKAARASPDDTSRSFRAAAHVPGTDTPHISRYAPEVLSCTRS